jgi:hypothetical protein
MSDDGTDASMDQNKERQELYASGWRAGYHAAMLVIEARIREERAKVKVT